MPLQQEQKMQRKTAPGLLVYALLFRIPAEVTECRTYRSGEVYPVCPTCRSSLDREYLAFCDRCGQRLDWDTYGRAGRYGDHVVNVLQTEQEFANSAKYK